MSISYRRAQNPEKFVGGGWTPRLICGMIVSNDPKDRLREGYRALDRPVLKDLPAVRYGRRYGKDAYPCRVIVYAEPGYPDPWDLAVSAGLTPWEPGRLVAAYGQRFTTEECFKDQKNDQYEGFHLDAVTLSTPERWDRMLLVFAWAYYWWNVAGWAMETAGKARQWQANTMKNYRTHALWRLGHWGGWNTMTWSGALCSAPCATFAAASRRCRFTA